LVSYRYLQQHVDEVFRVKHGSKHVNHKCPTCKRSVHFFEDTIADNVNGVLSRHVCNMKGRFNELQRR
jgi:hypothetical protein